MVRLPDFPWDRLAPARLAAESHPDGIVDLSVGTPVDPTPTVVQRALEAAANAPGYPTTHGTLELRVAIAEWWRRIHGADVDPAAVLPLIGTKEFVAWLPTIVEATSVAYPAVAYPTYEVGALIAGAAPVPTSDPTSLESPPSLLWINSPANPTGAVATVEELRRIVDWSRENEVVVASDECYIELPWDCEPVSLLDPRVCDGDVTGLLVVHSLSKRSNLAGYRIGHVTGDPTIVGQLLEFRKHAGMMMPAPMQAAGAAAYADDSHVVEQREAYRRRREVLLPAVREAGFELVHSNAGLYLWLTAGEDCWDTVDRLSALGILVAPGDFYGSESGEFVRMALTASDERIEAAAARLRGSGAT